MMHALQVLVQVSAFRERVVATRERAREGAHAIVHRAHMLGEGAAVSEETAAVGARASVALDLEVHRLRVHLAIPLAAERAVAVRAAERAARVGEGEQRGRRRRRRRARRPRRPLRAGVHGYVGKVVDHVGGVCWGDCTLVCYLSFKLPLLG